MRSNPVFCGMCRAMKTRDSDGQAARHPAERARPAGTGTCGQEVAGLARSRACQDLAAAVPAHAQPRGGQGAGPQHRDGARDLAALGQGGHGRALRQASHWRTGQARRRGCRAPGAVGARGTPERHRTVAAPSPSAGRTCQSEYAHPNAQGQRPGMETHAPQPEKSATLPPSPSPAKSSTS